MKLTVNILSWNTLRTLRLIFDILIKELSDISHEIIVVDQGSRDGTIDFFISQQEILNKDHITLRIIANFMNVGISKGKNQGIRAARGEYILLLDGDVVPVPNSIKKMIEFLDSDPDKKAIGMYPNKFAIERNNDKNSNHHEVFCHTLFEPIPFNSHCIFYGMFKREVFDKVMMDEEGEFGKPGYGWEDHDFYMQMKAAGITQWVANINHAGGKYYHAINSSISSQCLGYDVYLKSSKDRAEQYKEKWKDA